MKEQHYAKISSRGVEYIQTADGEILSKRCSTCREMKALEHFHNFKQGFGGKVPKCKPCRSQQAHTYYKNHTEYFSAYQKKYYQEHREQLREYDKRYQKENRKKIAERHRQYYQEKKHQKETGLK